ncbi:3-oxoacyl-ACP synthase [Sabulilitoribacter arenilitoris]|uniref:3-oxoacyl-ACP synthase n=1 Tax=Wocania arenilitoris TaxID=2044858 RepID=A0AAE3ENM0_9FLAO|nr:3-oxoacyl-ACP synthase [Wocania arenilitoris]MCF7568760.1 3-oxoacyl-ACP synthase [Wocania arenilitoris]
MSLKEKLYIQCVEFVDNRFQTIQNTINEIQESLQSETKSSAGDKHETGRAMLQLEREKAGNQLSEISKIKEALIKIDISKSSKNIGLGSVVYTTKANYYLAISAGELEVDNNKFYAISPNTPMGKLLIGKSVGDEVVFRGQDFIIIEVF